MFTKELIKQNIIFDRTETSQLVSWKKESVHDKRRITYRQKRRVPWHYASSPKILNFMRFTLTVDSAYCMLQNLHQWNKNHISTKDNILLAVCYYQYASRLLHEKWLRYVWTNIAVCNISIDRIYKHNVQMSTKFIRLQTESVQLIRNIP